MNSMTGFGRGEAEGDGRRVRIEVRSYNHRFLDISVRLPGELSALEDRIRKELAAGFSRGRLDVHVFLEESVARDRTVEVDDRLARRYHEAFSALASELGLHGQGTQLGLVVAQPGVLTVREAPPDLEAVWEVAARAVGEAADALAGMREVEGRAMARDLIHRIDRVEHLTGEIGAKAPLLTEEYRRKLTRRVSELLADQVVNEDRLTTEIVLYAERSNITEELVRLESHTEQFRALFEVDEPVGRKAEFILQEMVRETNTIGSKTQDPGIGRRVVEIKGELEKVREQVQNIE